MSCIAYFPAFIALLVILFYSLDKAFLAVYLPCLLIFSQKFVAHFTGLPDFGFAQSAIFPIGVIFLLKRAHRWKLSFTDLLVLAFVGWCIFASYHTYGYKQAQNLFIAYLVSVIFPYVLAKGIIEPRNLRVQFAKRFAFLLFLNLAVMLHSLLFDFSIHDRLWRKFFPRSLHALWFHHRFGLPRLPASFDHPILAGVIFAVGYRISRWLEWGKQWEARFRTGHLINISKGRMIGLGLLLALFLTLSRGPWFASMIGVLFCAAARSKTPSFSLVVRFLFAAVIFSAGWAFLEWYVSTAASGAVNTVRYRWDLWDMYRPHILAKPLFGWGVIDWPVAGMQSSVDNFFLYLAVAYGVAGSVLLACLIAYVTVRLFLRSLIGNKIKPRGSNLAFTLLAIQIIFIISISTVWMENQLLQIFFILLGWSEGYILSKKSISKTAPTELQELQCLP